jgi:hypothetical protein
MVRRSLVLMAVMGITVMLIAGCQGLRQAIRQASNEPPQTPKTGKVIGADEPSELASDPTKVLDVNADSKNLQPFFKNNRRSGTWSSEAREIESHLGVGP